MADWSNFGMSVAGNAATMGVNLLGQGLSGLMNNLFYRRNLDLQVQKQKELIDYQNAYNSPSAQMQRLSEAGLNPNLVYGSQAPAGQSGNASAPGANANPGSYNSADIIAGMMQMQGIKEMESRINLQNANAEKARADAEYVNTQNSQYLIQVNQNIKESNARIDELGSRIGLNKSSEELNYAKKLLTVADEEYRRGQINLQQYEKQVMLAQCSMFLSQTELNKMHGKVFEQQIKNMQMENALMGIEFRYRRIIESPEVAEEEKKARINELKRSAAKDAARIGIDGSKTAAWTDWAMATVGRLLGGAGTAMQGYNAYQKGSLTAKIASKL